MWHYALSSGETSHSQIQQCGLSGMLLSEPGMLLLSVSRIIPQPQRGAKDSQIEAVVWKVAPR